MLRITRDKSNVQSIVKLLKENLTNPFDPNKREFVSISIATLPPPKVARNLLDAHKVGKKAYKTFKKERLEGNPRKTEFHDKKTKPRLKMFSDIC